MRRTWGAIYLSKVSDKHRHDNFWTHYNISHYITRIYMWKFLIKAMQSDAGQSSLSITVARYMADWQWNQLGDHSSNRHVIILIQLWFIKTNNTSEPCFPTLNETNISFWLPDSLAQSSLMLIYPIHSSLYLVALCNDWEPLHSYALVRSK